MLFFCPRLEETQLPVPASCAKPSSPSPVSKKVACVPVWSSVERVKGRWWGHGVKRVRSGCDCSVDPDRIPKRVKGRSGAAHLDTHEYMKILCKTFLSVTHGINHTIPSLEWSIHSCSSNNNENSACSQ